MCNLFPYFNDDSFQLIDVTKKRVEAYLVNANKVIYFISLRVAPLFAQKKNSSKTYLKGCKRQGW